MLRKKLTVTALIILAIILLVVITELCKQLEITPSHITCYSYNECLQKSTQLITRTTTIATLLIIALTIIIIIVTLVSFLKNKNRT